MKKTLVLLALWAGLAVSTPAVFADDSDARVARVSYVGGDVSYQRGDDEGWNDLSPNTPLVTGDSFYAAEGGRAEVDLGSGVVVRVDGGTDIQLVNNSRYVAQFGMTSGVVDVRARSFPEGFTLEIDTPSGAVTILEPGRYRVEITDQTATYSVIRGGLSLALDGEQLDVREGECLDFENGDTHSYAYGPLGRRTSFTSWADDRDSRYERSASARYVNRDVVGYEDLDDHGAWRDSRGYGRVWVPSGVSQGWAPYQSGRWIWQDPYGWTWVSTESWGWAPYHYGRWVFVDNYWGWVPPPPRGYRGPSAVMNIQAVYAPALVAFVGGRNWGVSLSIGGPAIGWVPLAPAERYYYPWQPAPRVTNNYTNITVINAVTVVNYNNFGTTAVRPIRVDRAQIQQAPVLGYTAVGVVPTRASLAVSPSASPRPNAMPRGRTERPVVARLVPPPKPQPFVQKVVEIEKSGLPVARPVAIDATVGKPFVPGAPAPSGVKPFSARTPGGSKELKARAGAEARPPKRIERDIAPPPPAAARPPDPQPVAPPPIPQPRPGNGEGGRPEGNPNSHRQSGPSPPASTPPAQAPSQAVAPEPSAATPPPHGKPVNKNAPATKPPTKPVATPAPQSPDQPAAAKDKTTETDPETAPPVPPKGKKKKDKKAPEPPPEPVPPPPPSDGT